MKKFLAALLALSLTFGSVALPAAENGVIARGVNISASAEEYNYGDLWYKILDNGTIEISSYSDKGGKVVIPSMIKGRKVTSIGDRAFNSSQRYDEEEKITSITIPNTVVSIGEEAFLYCDRLKNITIPENVKSVGDGAFKGCKSLESVTIPNGVTCIDFNTFYNCSSLENITIPGSVTSIGHSAFSGCSNLKSIAIPESVTEIFYSAFSNCSSLTDINIPNNVTIIDSHTFYKCTSLKNIKIPEKVTDIDFSAFEGCKSLENITIPASVTGIDNRAFLGCTSLDSITVDPQNKEYSSENGVLFDKTKEIIVFYPAGKTSKEYIIPNTVTRILDNVFYGSSSLTSIVIPEYVGEIGKYAFYGCSNLASIVIPDAVDVMGECAFYGCSNLTSITLSSRLSGISDGVFGDCSSLTNITLPNNASYIGEVAFGGCKNLKSVIIPKSVMNIDEFAFQECTNLKDVYYTGSAKEWSKIEIEDNNEELTNAKIHCNYKPDHTHVYTSYIVKQPTCTENGIRINTCSICGAKITKTIPAKGHKSGNWIVDKPAAVGVKGSKHKECTVCGKVLETAEIPALSKQSISSATVSLSTTSYTYDGKSKKPSVTVKLGSKTLKNGTDYTVSYSNNKNIGTATVKIVGKGNYAGTIKKTFKISPVKMSVSKLSAKSKAFKASWTKNDQATGYEIQYATDSKFKTGKKVAITKKTTTAKTITKLKASKKYYVRMRIYTTVNGTKYYGAWSTVKTVTTKK